MERAERLLDLVALLLDRREPVSWAELREAFPEDYGSGSDEAAERKFERDKAELLELGIPLTYYQGDDDRKDGYVVDRDAYYLPEVGLTPEELAVLYAAGAAALDAGAFPAAQDLAHALRKVRFFAGSELPTPRVRMELSPGVDAATLASRLEQLWAAASARKWVDLVYYSPRGEAITQRRVDPYGLAFRRGLWSLVGYCHLRQDVRTFQVHRIRELVPNTAKPKTPDFEAPAHFQVDDYVARYPWEHAFHPAVDVQVRLTGELAPFAERLFPTAELTREDTAVRVTVPATDTEGLLRYALSLGAGCKVEAPTEVAERFLSLARKIAQGHAPAPDLQQGVA